MTRLIKLALLLAAVLTGLAVVPPAARGSTGRPAATTNPPNILLIISDDQRFDTIRALGNPLIKTPNLDHLVRTGVTFTRAYCMGSTSPAVCAPSRAMLLNGKTLFHLEGDVFRQTDTAHIMPEVFREAGYSTFATGKWHNGKPWFWRGFTHGDAIFFGGMGSHTDLMVHDFDPSGQYPDGARRPIEDYSSTAFANAAVRFLKNYKEDRPFFMQVSFTAPHDPRTPPPGYREMYEHLDLPMPKNFLPRHPFDNGELAVRDELLVPWPRTPPVIRNELIDYYAMITHMDAQIGRILNALKESNRFLNTFIVFTSDHGLALGSHGLLGKQNLYEHSMRVPLIISGPGLTENQWTDALVYLHDLFPTLCDLAGVKKPETIEFKSLAPLLSGRQKWVRDSLFTAYRDQQRAVCTERWKLIRYPQINKTQLFDLRHDADEVNDLAGQYQYRELVDELTMDLQRWQQKLGDSLPLFPAREESTARRFKSPSSHRPGRP